MKNGMIRIGMFEAYLERMLIRGLKVAYIVLAIAFASCSVRVK